MSLVLGLQKEITDKRNAILDEVEADLKGKGIEASFAEVPATDFSGKESGEKVIELPDGPVQAIRLLAYSYGTTTTLFRFQYELALDREMPADVAKSMKSAVKPVKSGGFHGLFGGEITA
jgi:hypothetical protein